MGKITKHIFIDIIRNKIVIGYTILLLIMSFSAFSLDNSSTKGIIVLLNLVLILVPMVSLIFSTIYLYNASEFIEMMVTQPIKRGVIWRSLMFGLMGSLSVSFILGAGLPLIILDGSRAAWMMLMSGVFLSMIFVSLAMLAVVITRDKAKGIGIGILMWFVFTLLYDGLVLFILFQFSDYPLEIPMLCMAALNPVDIARILVLLELDISALMGYTGAVFSSFFKESWGFVITLSVLCIWIIIPSYVSFRKFRTKDL